MLNSIASYALAFVLTAWFPTTSHRLLEMMAAAEDLGTTDATFIEAARMMNIAHEETGFERSKVGDLGERGRWQIRPWAWTTDAELEEWTQRGAHEALRRFRAQGIYGYMGCAKVTARCVEMARERLWQADLYSWAYPPPESEEAAPSTRTIASSIP
jgi:hypothetical protein